MGAATPSQIQSLVTPLSLGLYDLGPISRSFWGRCQKGHAGFTIGEIGVAMATGQSGAWGVPQSVSESGPRPMSGEYSLE